MVRKMCFYLFKEFQPINMKEMMELLKPPFCTLKAWAKTTLIAPSGKGWGGAGQEWALGTGPGMLPPKASSTQKTCGKADRKAVEPQSDTITLKKTGHDQNRELLQEKLVRHSPNI